MILILTGPSGVGKTTIGCLLAERLGRRFFDGDAYHSKAAVKKMAKGFPLTDEDRQPWLAAIQSLILSLDSSHEEAVIACSALKLKYRDYLRVGCGAVQFVHLRGEFNLVAERLQKRQDHFAKRDLLASQFAGLEDAEDGLVVDVTRTPAEIVTHIIADLRLQTR